MSEKHQIKKNKLIVLNYDFMPGENAKYTSYMLVKTLKEFDFLEEKRNSRLHGTRFINWLIHEGFVKKTDYHEVGIGGFDECVVKKVGQ